MSASRVSVVMAAFNTAPFIGEAIESVLGQTLHELELLVIDDGSTDATSAIVGGVADRRVRLIRNPANLGPAASRDVGFALASGRYVAIMDSDDIAVPDRLAIQVDEMERNPDIAVCGSNVELFGLASRNSDVPPGDAEIKAMLLAAARNILNPTAMVRLDFVRRHDVRYRSDLAVAEDYAFWLECMYRGARFANLKQPLVRYRSHAANASQRIADRGAAVTRLRRGLIGELFPALSGSDVAAVGDLFDQGSLGFERLCTAVVASRRAQADMQSRFGENRRMVAGLLESRIALAHRAMTRPAVPSDATSVA